VKRMIRYNLVGVHFYPWNAEKHITLLLLMRYLLKKEGCSFYKYVDFYITGNINEKMLELMRKLKNEYKRLKEPVASSFYKEFVYIYASLREALFGDDPLIAAVDVNYVGGQKFVFTSVMPRGACLFCPLVERREACDKRPSDYVAKYWNVYRDQARQLYELFREKKLWLQVLNEEEKRALVERVKRTCMVYERSGWECANDPLDWRRVPCSSQEFWRNLCAKVLQGAPCAQGSQRTQEQ